MQVTVCKLACTYWECLRKYEDVRNTLQILYCSSCDGKIIKYITVLLCLWICRFHRVFYHLFCLIRRSLLNLIIMVSSAHQTIQITLFFWMEQKLLNRKFKSKVQFLCMRNINWSVKAKTLVKNQGRHWIFWLMVRGQEGPMALKITSRT
jgi:hypothetical protein